MVHSLRVPLYGALLYIVVSEDPLSLRKGMSDLFGEAPEDDFEALCSYDNNGTFALFFTPTSLTPSTIAHEIFHLTHRIGSWRYGNFVEAYHEVLADLCGYLTDQVVSITGSCRLTIVEPDTTKIQVAQKDGFSVGGAD